MAMSQESLQGALGLDDQHWEAVGPRASVRRADWADVATEIPRASLDLIYVDPPFNTGKTHTDRSGAFQDAWPTTCEYIEWLRRRVVSSIIALKPTGALLVHVDYRTSHHVRLLLDEALGEANFVNHLIWEYGLGGSSPRRFARKHDDILYYAATPDGHWFEPPMVPATSRRMQGQLKKATDVLRVASINNMAQERVGWPTQKPLALLELLIRACCPPGGVVFDPCCGSGTTAVAALRTGRAALVSDVNADAITLTRSRIAETIAAMCPDQPVA